MLQRDTEPPLSERQRKMVDEAEKSCIRMVALINELSEISKLDAGLAAVTAERFDLFDMVRDVAGGVHDAEDRGVRIDVRTDGAAAPMHGDLTRLRAAIAVTLRAIAREQPSATIVVADCRRVVRSGAEEARVVVAPAADAEAAREASEGPFDDKRGGLGLALPIARRVLERHGGRIWSPRLGASSESSETSAGRGALVVSIPLLEQSR